MPSFNTHWLVAMKCTKNGGLPDYIVKGFDKYKTETQLFKPESANLFWIDCALSETVAILPSALTTGG